MKEQIQNNEMGRHIAHPQGKNYLLTIAINKYKYFPPLNNAIKDVIDLNNILSDSYGFDKNGPNTMHLWDDRATRRNIIQKLNHLSEVVNTEDRVLIYYSGHGHLNPKTKLGYWIPEDAERGHYGDYIANSDVRDYIKAMDCKHILLISDSCFSGSLLARDGNRDISGAFNEWDSSRSRWIFCSGRGIVSDGTPGENSPFAKQLLRRLSDDKTDKINIARLADDVIRSVRYNYEQQPEACPLFGANHDGGQFVFFRRSDRIETKESTFDEIQVTTDISPNNYWKNIQINKQALNWFIVAISMVLILSFSLWLGLKGAKRESSFVTNNNAARNFDIPYPIIKLAGLNWTSQNLNIETTGSWCYNNQAQNCNDFGRLYTWEAAKKACSRLGKGWRLPTDAEWTRIANTFGGYYDSPNSKTIGDPMKSLSYLLNEKGSSFPVPLSGYRNVNANFNGAEISAHFWSSTEFDEKLAYNIGLYNRPEGGLHRRRNDKSLGFSCRCVRD